MAEPSATSTIRIGAVGDIMTARAVGERFDTNPSLFEADAVKEVLGRNDYVLANLETPVSERGTPDPRQDRHVTFCAAPASLQILKSLDIDGVSLANNHMLDYGPQALNDTLRHLDNAGIDRFGAGRNYEEANAPLLRRVNGNDVAIIGTVFIFSASTDRATASSAGVAHHSFRLLLRRIRKCRNEGRIVIVSVHWGLEYSFYPVPYQMRQARAMVDAGASLVLGHGPHFPQGIERYGKGEIIYSLGNFVFDEPYLYSQRSFAYSAEIGTDGAVLSHAVDPVVLSEFVPRLATGRQREKLLRNILSLGPIYERKEQRFWKQQSGRYFRDLVWRVSGSKSLRFLKLPPLSFYWDVGWRNYVSKMRSFLRIRKR